MPLPSQLEKMSDSMAPQMDVLPARFKVRSLNMFINSLNPVLHLFGVRPVPLAVADGPLSQEMAQNLNMVFRAAKAAGVIEEPLDLASIKTERDLTGLAVQLDQLAEDEKFRAFLSEAPDLEEPPTGEGVNKPPAKPEVGGRFSKILGMR